MIYIAISDPSINFDITAAVDRFIYEASQEFKWMETIQDELRDIKHSIYLRNKEQQTLANVAIKIFEEPNKAFISFCEKWSKLLKDEIERIQTNQNVLSFFNFNFNTQEYNAERNSINEKINDMYKAFETSSNKLYSQTKSSPF